MNLLPYRAEGCDRRDKVKDLEKGRVSWIVHVGPCYHRSPYKRELRQSVVKKTHEDEIRGQSGAAMRQGM